MRFIYKLLFILILFLAFGNTLLGTLFSISFCEEETLENINNFESKEKVKGTALFSISVLLFIYYLKCIKTGSGCDFNLELINDSIISYFDTSTTNEQNNWNYTAAEQEEIIKKAEKEMYSSVEAFEKSIQNMDPELRKKWIFIKTQK